MDYVELKAEVFRVMRAFNGTNPKKLLSVLKEHLGENYDKELIVKVLSELLEEAA